ncbi:hypothetical protein FI667_g16744, partial [Globisporangium splendens]
MSGESERVKSQQAGQVVKVVPSLKERKVRQAEWPRFTAFGTSGNTSSGPMDLPPPPPIVNEWPEPAVSTSNSTELAQRGTRIREIQRRVKSDAHAWRL